MVSYVEPESDSDAVTCTLVFSLSSLVLATHGLGPLPEQDCPGRLSKTFCHGDAFGGRKSGCGFWVVFIKSFFGCCLICQARPTPSHCFALLPCEGLVDCILSEADLQLNCFCSSAAYHQGVWNWCSLCGVHLSHADVQSSFYHLSTVCLSRLVPTRKPEILTAG